MFWREKNVIYAVLHAKPHWINHRATIKWKQTLRHFILNICADVFSVFVCLDFEDRFSVCVWLGSDSRDSIKIYYYFLFMYCLGKIRSSLGHHYRVCTTFIRTKRNYILLNNCAFYIKTFVEWHIWNLTTLAWKGFSYIFIVF